MKDQRIDVNCALCGSLMKVKRPRYLKCKSGNFFCSHACRGAWIRNDYDRSLGKPNEGGEQEFTCLTCGKKFKRYKINNVSDNVYCSRECYGKSKRHMTEICMVCGKEFPVGLRNQRKTCSYKCAHTRPSTSVETTCLQCGAKFTRAPSLKAKFCSPGCASEYNNTHNAKYRDTKPELHVKQWLRDNGIPYRFQYRIGRYFADFYLPDYNCVLEVYGDYWHVNPKVYGEQLTPEQAAKREKDAKRERKLIELGHSFTKVWECDLYADADKTLTDALAPYVTICPLGKRAPYNEGVEREHTREDAMAFIAQFNGL